MRAGVKVIALVAFRLVEKLRLRGVDLRTTVRKFSESVRGGLTCVLSLALLLSSHGSAGANQKMSSEEIIAKHMEAIGSTETLSSISSRIIVGEAVATFKEPGTGQVGGRAVFASEGTKSMLGLVFDNTNYPHDKVGYDGDRITSSYVRPGVRSTLGDFLVTHTSILKHGLFGGTLSSAWPLLDASKARAKFDASGPKKVDGRQVYEVKYLPKDGSDVRISLFFDAETFHHVRTEYTRLISAPQGLTPADSARQRESRYKMVEEFADFKRVSGLTLPHTYRIKLNLDTLTGSFVAEWDLNFSQFSFNQKIEPGSFKMSAD